MRGIIKICKVTLLVLLNMVFLCAGLIIRIFPAKDMRLRAGTIGMSIWARWTCTILGIRTRKNRDGQNSAGIVCRGESLQLP